MRGKEGGRERDTLATIQYVWVSFVTRRTIATISYKDYTMGYVMARTVYAATCVAGDILLSFLTSRVGYCPSYNNIIFHRKIKCIFYRTTH
jgi:hypothetical protein